MYHVRANMGDARKDYGVSRRQVVGRIGAALLGGTGHDAGAGLRVLGRDVAIRIAPVSPHTVRLSVLAVKDGKAAIRR